MASIFFVPASLGKSLTKTALPTEGLWMPVLPRIVQVSETSSWETRQVVGVGDVPTSAGRGLTSITWQSLFPAFYDANFCRGIPTRAYWHTPGFMVKKMRNIMLNQDVILATINDDSSAMRLGSPTQFEGAFIEEPMRITKFDWEVGAREVVAYQVTLEGLQPRAHVEAMFWGEDLTYVDPQTGNLVAGGAGTGKASGSKQALRANETVAAMLIRAFGIAQGAKLQKATNLTLTHNNCDNNGISKGSPISLATNVERVQKGKRHTYIIVPPGASALGGGAKTPASVGVGSKLQGK